MRKLVAASLVIGSLGFGITSFALAQDARPAQPPAPPTDHSMMGNDMSGMMTRMNKMMDACEQMMKTKDRREQKGDRG
jgi:hypothetical protein